MDIFFKIDLRDDVKTLEKLSTLNMEPITFSVAENKAEKIGAVKYVECSALTQKGLSNVFDEAIRVVMAPKVTKMCVHVCMCVCDPF